MLVSMTGYGYGEISENGISSRVELRSVNSRYLEVSSRLPRSLSIRENEIKEILRKKVSRGKVTVNVIIEHVSAEAIPLKLNLTAAKTYADLLNELKKSLQLKDEITLNHILKFSEVLEVEETVPLDGIEWAVTEKALAMAIDELVKMKSTEGSELEKDLLARISSMESAIDKVEVLSKEHIPAARLQLQTRVAELLTDRGVIDQQRLELEIALIADRLDITEECVRFRSHITYFRSLIHGNDNAGRTMNFLLQEINREVNTIGSKANDATISQIVVGVKEELEKIREQMQNIE